MQYDIPSLSAALEAQGTRLVYVPETTSTMDLALDYTDVPSLVLTEHQTAGRGRYGRSWLDSGQAILMTLTRAISTHALPPQGSLLLSHLFVLAVRQATGRSDVLIKWPNDIYIDGKKLGGVLMTQAGADDAHSCLLFGVGLNITTPLHDAASLPNVDRGELILAINHTLDIFLADLPRMYEPAVYDHYNQAWKESSALLGKTIRITGYGERADMAVEGRVTGSNLGEFLQLTLSNGTIMELREYGHKAALTIL